MARKGLHTDLDKDDSEDSDEVSEQDDYVSGIMEIEPDIENMTLNEYLEYEAEKERRLWDNLRSKSSPTRPSQPHNERGYESPNTNNKVDIDMTIAEYNLYIARQMKNPLNNHSYSFSPQFFAQPPNTPNTPVDKKDSDFDEILDDLFSVGAKNLRRMGREKVQMGGMLTHPGIQTIKATLNVTVIPTKLYSDDELLENWMLLKEADLEHG
ncbi:hypothetical protein Tco_0718481 [Tanacetum coccineum]